MKPLATSGTDQAQQMLGNLYYLGLEVRQGLETAASFFEQSAIQGKSSAQYNLGLVHHNGGVAADNVTAAAWFMLADAAGNTSAQAYLRTLSGMMNPNKIQQAHTLKDSLEIKIRDNQMQ